MKKIEKIKQNLEKLRPILKEKFQVKNIGVFGSFIRGEQAKKSDLDVLVEFSEIISLFKFIDLENFLSKELDVKVDLVMKDVLKPQIKDIILREVVYL